MHPTGAVVDARQMRLAAHRAVAMAERLDSTELLSLALDVEHITYEVRDDVKAMAAGVERRRRLADRSARDRSTSTTSSTCPPRSYWEQGRLRDARLVSEEGVSRVTALGGHAMGSSATLAISRFLLGDWDAALEEGQRIRDRFGDNPPGFLRVAWGATEYVLSSRGSSRTRPRSGICRWRRRCGWRSARSGWRPRAGWTRRGSSSRWRC